MIDPRPRRKAHKFISIGLGSDQGETTNERKVYGSEWCVATQNEEVVLLHNPLWASCAGFHVVGSDYVHKQCCKLGE